MSAKSDDIIEAHVLAACEYGAHEVANKVDNIWPSLSKSAGHSPLREAFECVVVFESLVRLAETLRQAQIACEVDWEVRYFTGRCLEKADFSISTADCPSACQPDDDMRWLFEAKWLSSSPAAIRASASDVLKMAWGRAARTYFVGFLGADKLDSYAGLMMDVAKSGDVDWEDCSDIEKASTLLKNIERVPGMESELVHLYQVQFESRLD